MALNDLDAPLRVKPFPPGRRGVLLPTDSPGAAAAGLAMYTASKPLVVRAQRVSHYLTSRLGARWIPTRSIMWSPPCGAATWAELLEQWDAHIGSFDSLAIYQRRQLDRSGLTLTLVNEGRPLAVVKVRDDERPLLNELAALVAVRRSRPRSFRVPAPLASGAAGGVFWSAQESVFDRPHAPQFIAAPELFEEVAAGLQQLDTSHGPAPIAHNDLTPWNLRVGVDGKIWLFDWEDVGPAPFDADRTYFHAASHALSGGSMPSGLATDAIDHWERIVAARRATNTGDRELSRGLLEALTLGRRQSPVANPR